MTRTPVLENERALLTPLTEADIEALRPIAREAALWTYGLTDLTVEGELEKYVHSALNDMDNGTAMAWIITDKTSGAIAGCTRLAEISVKDLRGQIGWTWIGAAFQGTGLNRAVKSAILTFGFDTLNLNRIELKADERNIQSRKAMLKIGAREEGTLRQHMRTHDGYLRNTVFYSILKEEWDRDLRF